MHGEIKHFQFIKANRIQILRIFNLRAGFRVKIFLYKIGWNKIISIFARRFKRMVIVPWCNGSTTDFGSVCLGSNPGGTTKNPAHRRVFLFCIFFVR